MLARAGTCSGDATVCRLVGGSYGATARGIATLLRVAKPDLKRNTLLRVVDVDRAAKEADRYGIVTRLRVRNFGRFIAIDYAI